MQRVISSCSTIALILSLTFIASAVRCTGKWSLRMNYSIYYTEYLAFLTRKIEVSGNALTHLDSCYLLRINVCAGA
jgi:hypothetical protein